MCFEMSVNKTGLWHGNLSVLVEKRQVLFGPRVGVMHGPSLLCALILLPARLMWGSPLSAELPRPHTLPSSSPPAQGRGLCTALEA